jgi:hypothetical protein
MQEWIGELEHPDLLTDDAKTVLNEYKSREEFMVAGLNAKRKVGKPYRLPESLEKLPDDNVRTQFKGDISKLIGHDFDVIDGEESLSGINFAEGLADARTVNEAIKKAFAEFAIAEKLPKSLAQKIVGLNNKLATEFANTSAKAKKDHTEKVSEIVKGLYGGEEGVKGNRELVKRLFDKHGGLTTEEYEELNGIIDAGTANHVVLNKALFNIAKGLVPESETENRSDTGPGKKESMAERQNKHMPIITGTLWPKK